MAPVANFRSWPDMVTRGWGSMQRSGQRWTFVPEYDQMVTVPGVTGKVHKAIAPLVTHLLSWLVAHRDRPLDAEGNWGLAVRPIRGAEAAAYAGSVSAWSNHSAGLAVDIEAPRNPMGAAGGGDFPAGWLDECHRYGFAWGASSPQGDYVGRPDRMHIEFIGTPAQAAEYVAALGGSAGASSTTSTRKGENVLENHRVSGTGSIRLNCPTGKTSMITARAWVSASVDGPNGGSARVWFQSDQAGISDTTWKIGFSNGRSDRAWAELPDGTTTINIQYAFDGAGTITLETLGK